MLEPDEGKLSRPVLRAGGGSNPASLTRRQWKRSHATSPVAYPTKPAILSNAAALLCCHNHPSGAPQPSQEDRALTKRLVDAGQLLGIHVIDHIILGDGSETYYSFADEQLL
jgi:DNA repair protein RadC